MGSVDDALDSGWSKPRRVGVLRRRIASNIALTSRPPLLAAVGRAVNHSAKTTLYLTPMRAETRLIESRVAHVRAAIVHVKRAAEQSTKIDRRATLPAYICHRIVAQSALPTPPG